MSGNANQKINPFRLLAKALVLYIIANILFAVFEPSVGELSIYNWLVSGRTRLPFERPENVSKGYSMPLFQDLDAAFASHVISGREKPGDEYRVILVGDSSVWGFAANSSDTLSAKLNDLNLRSCDGRRMRFYNLGYPGSLIFKDLFVLEKSREYNPDMVLWLFTMHALTGTSKDFTDSISGSLITDAKWIQAEYHLKDYTSELIPQSFWEKTIVGQRKRLKADFVIQAYGFLWEATGIDHHLQAWLPWKENLEDGLGYRRYKSPEDWPRLKQNFILDVIHAGHEMMGGVEIVVVNEPIYIASGLNSEIRYNKFYPRWAYDNYREYLNTWMLDNDYPYLDMWQVVPQEEFSDMPLHLYPRGEQILAENIVPGIFNYSCKSK